MKYLLIAMVLGAAFLWWMERRRGVVRARMAARMVPMKQLTACPRCGVYAAEGEHSCG